MFGCSHFLVTLLHSLHYAVSDWAFCSIVTIAPQFYRVVSLYLIIGSLFLRSLFLKHAKAS